MKHLLTTLMLLCCALTASADVFPYAWEGKMGNNINIKLEVEESTFGTLIGRTTYYRKNGTMATIPCYGHRIVYDEGASVAFALTEFDGTKVCGNYILEMGEGESFEGGRWSLLDKEYDLNSFVDLNPAPGSDYMFAPISNINEAVGTYSFTYKTGNPNMPECGGSCTITKKGANQIHWSMTQVTPNIAEAEGDATLDGSYFTGRHGDFTFEAYIDRNFIYVQNTNTEPFEVDDWGAWATIEGIYVREK